VTEGQALLDAVFIRRMDPGCASQCAAAFGILGLKQVAFAGAGAQDFAASSNLEPFGGGFLRFNAFWTSHKVSLLSKRARNIGCGHSQSKRVF
jgi:hypothetical protein